MFLFTVPVRVQSGGQGDGPVPREGGEGWRDRQGRGEVLRVVTGQEVDDGVLLRGRRQRLRAHHHLRGQRQSYRQPAVVQQTADLCVCSCQLNNSWSTIVAQRKLERDHFCGWMKKLRRHCVANQLELSTEHIIQWSATISLILSVLFKLFH